MEEIKFYAYGITLPIILIVGIFGNTLNLLVLRGSNFKSVTFIFLRWLSFSDLIALIIYITGVMEGFGYDFRNSSSRLEVFYEAHVTRVVSNGFLASSALLVVAISLERYLAVCHPLTRCLTGKKAHLLVAFCYLLSFLVYLPRSFEFSVETNFTTSTYHSEYCPQYGDHTAYKVYVTLREILVKLVPISLVIILNSLTLLQFRRVLKARRGLLSGKQGESNSRKKLREERRVMMMLVCVAAVFLVCLPPMAVASVTVTAELRRNTAYQIFLIVANLMETLNSAINFYMYILTCRDFRSECYRVVSCGTEPNSSRPTRIDTVCKRERRRRGDEVQHSESSFSKI